MNSKNLVRICALYLIVNCYLHDQSKALQKSVEQVYGVDGIGEVYFIQLLHMFLQMEEALGEELKQIQVRVNPNSPMTFMADITNEERKLGDIKSIID